MTLSDTSHGPQQDPRADTVCPVGGNNADTELGRARARPSEPHDVPLQSLL
jgi:hypothetical protein